MMNSYILEITRKKASVHVQYIFNSFTLQLVNSTDAKPKHAAVEDDCSFPVVSSCLFSVLCMVVIFK